MRDPQTYCITLTLFLFSAIQTKTGTADPQNHVSIEKINLIFFIIIFTENTKKYLTTLCAMGNTFLSTQNI